MLDHELRLLREQAALARLYLTPDELHQAERIARSKRIMRLHLEKLARLTAERRSNVVPFRRGGSR